MVDSFSISLALLSMVALGISWGKNRGKTRRAVKYAIINYLMLLPLFVGAFILISLLKGFVSKGAIVSLLGGHNPIFEPLIAVLVGGFASLPAPVSYPIAKYLLEQHASATVVGTFVVALTTVGTITLPLEIKMLGRKFALTRWVFMTGEALIVGILMGWLL